MVLVYIAKKLKDALALEEHLTKTGIDYAVEVDTYTGGVVFRSERTGVFFYVEAPEHDRALETLRDGGFKPVLVE